MSTLVTNHGQTALNVYGYLVAAGAVIGAFKGIGKWIDWYGTRRYRKIPYETIEPVVNIACDVGKLSYNVITSGLLSGAITATAPVSVPIILYVCEDEKKTDQNKQN